MITMFYWQGQLWVCTTCMIARENAEESDPCECDPAHEPWSREPTTDVAHGVLEHADDCDGDESDQCECAVDSFSLHSCDACGCPLAGERHAYVWH